MLKVESGLLIVTPLLESFPVLPSLNSMGVTTPLDGVGQHPRGYLFPHATWLLQTPPFHRGSSAIQRWGMAQAVDLDARNRRLQIRVGTFWRPSNHDSARPVHFVTSKNVCRNRHFREQSKKALRNDEKRPANWTANIEQKQPIYRAKLGHVSTKWTAKWTANGQQTPIIRCIIRLFSLAKKVRSTRKKARREKVISIC